MGLDGLNALPILGLLALKYRLQAVKTLGIALTMELLLTIDGGEASSDESLLNLLEYQETQAKNVNEN